MSDNVIDGMRHSIRCPFLRTRAPNDCDCHPLDESKAMRGPDVLRIFAPLAPEEAQFLKYLDRGNHMTEPTDIDTYTARAMAGQRISGHGLQVRVDMPCPFCAAPGFMSWLITEMQEPHAPPSKGATCTECDRSAKMIFTRAASPHGRDGDSASFELVQTGGPDQPEWLMPKMRRV